MITAQAMKAGFQGGLVVDYPNSTKAKKYFLVLNAGGVKRELPAAIDTGLRSQATTQAINESKRSVV